MELPEPGENLEPCSRGYQAGFMANYECSHCQKHEGERYVAAFFLLPPLYLIPALCIGQTQMKAREHREP